MFVVSVMTRPMSRRSRRHSSNSHENRWPTSQVAITIPMRLVAESSPLPPLPANRPKPRRARHLDQDQVQMLVQDYAAGATTYELGDRFGIDRRTVSAILHQFDVPMRRRGLSPSQVDEAIHLYRLGWSLARVGEHLDVDPTTVLNRLQERGIRTRDTHGRARS